MTIRIYFGLNGSGKSYLMTAKIVELLLSIDSGKKKYRGHKVFSNYPVNYEKKTWSLRWIKRIIPFPIRKSKMLSSCIWTGKSMQNMPIINASIFIDEAYEDYDSRDWKNFKKDDITFFTKHRHNDLDFYFSLARAEGIDTVLRNLCSYWYHVKNFKIPGTDIVLFFTSDIYLDLDDYSLRLKHKNYRYGRIVTRPKKAIYKSYDTKMYRKEIVDCDYTQWKDIDIDEYFRGDDKNE